MRLPVVANCTGGLQDKRFLLLLRLKPCWHRSGSREYALSPVGSKLTGCHPHPLFEKLGMSRSFLETGEDESLPVIPGLHLS